VGIRFALEEWCSLELKDMSECMMGWVGRRVDSLLLPVTEALSASSACHAWPGQFRSGREWGWSWQDVPALS
jgi:hypothetical protein